jgi:hypothetical protein
VGNSVNDPVGNYGNVDRSLQRPARKAVERDEAEIARWVAQEWPRIKQTVSVWACGPGGSLSGSGAGIAA